MLITTMQFALGILLFLCILFQISVAKKWLHVPFKWHRVTGYIILCLAVIHGFLGLGIYFGFLIF